tara:strand:+ start:76 stop:1479 length:1404 start_codon:yes stop_codon:yes gene_type:complete
MIRPAIQPTLAFRPISRGLITAAKNSVNKVQESTQTISKGLNKNQKFAMNYVEFFGSKKTAKILKKNLKSIKESLMSTFEMAKTLKKKVAEMSKGGGLGGLLGGAVGFLGKGLLGGVLGKALLFSLVGLATGGITFLLARNVGKFFKFLDENIDQLTPIIEKIVKRTASKALMPSGLPELIDEIDNNVSDNVISFLESDDNLSRDEAVKKSVQLELDKLQKSINDLKLDRSKLGFFDIGNRIGINSAIRRFEQAQSFLKTGDKFENIERDLGTFTVVPAFTAKFFANKFLGGTPVPTGYNNMTAKSRQNAVVNFVENSSKNLDALEFEVLRSSKLAGRFSSESQTRFYEDVLNYIKAKKSSKGTKEFKVLPEQFDINSTRSGNIEEFKNRFGSILKPKSKKESSNVNINVGDGNTQQQTNNSGEEKISSAPADSGILGIPFLSALNPDLAMERGTASLIYGNYMSVN